MGHIVNGHNLAEKIKRELISFRAGLSYMPRLVLMYVGEDPRVDSFLSIKQKFGASVGVDVVIKRFGADSPQETLLREIDFWSRAEDSEGSRMYHGIVVQLPLPKEIDTDTVINTIPVDRDVDVLSAQGIAAFASGGILFPPVTGAIREVLRAHSVSLAGKNIVIVGKGRLVGEPTMVWLDALSLPYTLIRRDTKGVKQILTKADIIISGAGSPHLITPDMISEGVVLIDAGTSSDAGTLRGDIHPGCADKAQLLTPVPGGIGPLTVAVLFRNLFHQFL